MEINIIDTGYLSLIDWLEQNNGRFLDFTPIKSHGITFGHITCVDVDVNLPKYWTNVQSKGNATIYKEYIYLNRNIYLVTWKRF